MLRLFTRNHSSRPALPMQRKVKLRLEHLETRDCPAAPVLGMSAAPTNVGKQVQIQGTVQDENPAGVTITLSGVVSGSITPKADGTYSYVTTASGLGTITAVARDQESLSSNSVSAQITSATPSMSLVLNKGPNGTSVSGVVTDEARGGLTVTLGGAMWGSTLTNSDGSFTYSGPAIGSGAVTGSIADVWGNATSVTASNAANKAPQIVDFIALQGAHNTWSFEGRVLDENPQGLRVYFGGLPELELRSTVVECDGSFSFTTTLSPGEHGTATAQVQDWWGLWSNEAEAIVG